MSLAARATTDVTMLALDAFLQTVASTLHEATGVGIDDPPHGRSDEAISVIIHARGSLSGVTWRFPVALAARAAWKMAPDMVPDHALCVLAAGELANMLTGRGLEALAGCGVRIEIEPPQIAVACAPGISGELRTELGAVEVVFHGLGRST